MSCYTGFGHGFKGLGNVLIGQGTYLETFNSFNLTEFIYFFPKYLSRLYINLVANQIHFDIRLTVFLNLAEPMLNNIIKSLLTLDVIDKKHSVHAIVIGFGDGSKAIVSCCVPNLELH